MRACERISIVSRSLGLFHVGLGLIGKKGVLERRKWGIPWGFEGWLRKWLTSVGLFLMVVDRQSMT